MRRRPPGRWRMDVASQIPLPRCAAPAKRPARRRWRRLPANSPSVAATAPNSVWYEPARGGGDETVQRMRQCEHQVEVRHRQHFAPARREPRLFGPRLTARAVPVAARVVQHDQLHGPSQDSRWPPSASVRQAPIARHAWPGSRSTGAARGSAGRRERLGQAGRWHALALLIGTEQIERRGGAGQARQAGQVEVAHGRAHMTVTEQALDGVIDTVSSRCVAAATTSGRCRNCSATATFRRRSCTRMCSTAMAEGCGVRSTS